MLARLKPVNIHWFKERSPLRGSEKNVCATIFVPFYWRFLKLFMLEIFVVCGYNFCWLYKLYDDF